MSSRHSRLPDEESPLLQHASDQEHDPKPARDLAQQETPLPVAQFSLVLLLQLAEPLTSQLIYPFAPQLIREIGITHGDDTKVGYYVGLMQSIFFGAQALTVLHWSRMSDLVGRKPVILIGVFGLSLSMYCFGLSRSFWGLVISRSLSGALNGNIGVLRSMVVEMTDSTNIARAFAYQPIAWSSGTAIGPLIGGTLAHPAERFPDLFGSSDFLKRYPYFLPCAIPATFSLLAWVVTYLFLKETNQTGFSIRSQLRRLLQRDQSSANPLKLDPGTELDPPPPPPTLRSLLTRPVLLSIATYALLSLLDIAHRSLQPVFYSAPRKYGGLELPPPIIGKLLAILGIANGVFQVGFFFRMVKRWGAKKVYLLGIASAIPMIALFPIMIAVVHMEDNRHVAALVDTPLSSAGSEAAEDYSLSVPLIILLALQLLLTPLFYACYGCVFMFISQAASIRRPSLSSRSNASSKYTPNNYSSSSSSSSSTSSPLPSRSPSTTDLSSKHEQHSTSTACRNRSKSSNRSSGGSSSSGGSTLGAVNGVSQCTVSIMRCVGPYAASSLYSAGLSWQYGPSGGAPPDGMNLRSPGSGPSSGQELLVGANSLPTSLLGDVRGVSGEWWRGVAGSSVFWVLIALTCLTLLVGANVPEGGWEAEAQASEEERRDKDGESDEED